MGSIPNHTIYNLYSPCSADGSALVLGTRGRPFDPDHGDHLTMRGNTMSIASETRARILDIIHSKDLQDELMSNPDHQDAQLLDYVFDLKLQSEIMEE